MIENIVRSFRWGCGVMLSAGRAMGRDPFFWATLIMLSVIAQVPMEMVGGDADYALLLLFGGVGVAFVNSHRFFHRGNNVGYFLMYSFCSFIFIMAFAFSYTGYGMNVGDGKVSYGIFDAVYLSVITWTSVGYGDVSPIGDGRMFAMAEGLLSYLYMALLIAKIMTLIRGDRQ